MVFNKQEDTGKESRCKFILVSSLWGIIQVTDVGLRIPCTDMLKRLSKMESVKQMRRKKKAAVSLVSLSQQNVVLLPIVHYHHIDIVSIIHRYQQPKPTTHNYATSTPNKHHYLMWIQ